MTPNSQKTPFGETPWLTGRHATPLVSLFFIITMLLTERHAMPVVILWSTTSATDLRECFLLSGVFYLTLLPASFKASLGAGSSTSRLAGFHADLRNIVLAWLFVWITTIHKRVILAGLFKGHGWSATWRICSARDSNSLHDKLNMSEALCFIPLATESTIN